MLAIPGFLQSLLTAIPGIVSSGYFCCSLTLQLPQSLPGMFIFREVASRQLKFLYRKIHFAARGGTFALRHHSVSNLIVDSTSRLVLPVKIEHLFGVIVRVITLWFDQPASPKGLFGLAKQLTPASHQKVRHSRHAGPAG